MTFIPQLCEVSLRYFPLRPLTGLLTHSGSLTGAVLPVRQTPDLEARPLNLGGSHQVISHLSRSQALLALLGTLTEAALPVCQGRTLKLVPHFYEDSPSCSSPQPLTGLLAHLGTLARAVVPVRQHRFLWNSTSETRPPSLRGRIEFPQGSRSQASFTGPLAGSHISHGQRRRYVTTGSKCFTPFFLAGSHRVVPRLCASQACSTGKALSPGTSTPVLEDRPSGVSLSYFSPQPLTGLLALLGTLTGAVSPVRQDGT